MRHLTVYTLFYVSHVGCTLPSRLCFYTTVVLTLFLHYLSLTFGLHYPVSPIWFYTAVVFTLFLQYPVSHLCFTLLGLALILLYPVYVLTWCYTTLLPLVLHADYRLSPGYTYPDSPWFYSTLCLCVCLTLVHCPVSNFQFYTTCIAPLVFYTTCLSPLVYTILSHLIFALPCISPLVYATLSHLILTLSCLSPVVLRYSLFPYDFTLQCLSP